MRRQTLLFGLVPLTAILSGFAGVGRATEEILPEEALQKVYTAIVRRASSQPAHRQFVKDLKELVQLCRLAEEQLKVGKDPLEACRLIESKAEELKRDRKLLEHEISLGKSSPKPWAKKQEKQVPPLIDGEAASKAVLPKLALLQEKLNALVARVNQPTATRQELRSQIKEILDHLEPPKKKVKEIRIVPQPTFGMYEPKPREPRTQGIGGVPAYLQSDPLPSSQKEKSPGPR